MKDEGFSLLCECLLAGLKLWAVVVAALTALCAVLFFEYITPQKLWFFLLVGAAAFPPLVGAGGLWRLLSKNWFLQKLDRFAFLLPQFWQYDKSAPYKRDWVVCFMRSFLSAFWLTLPFSLPMLGFFVDGGGSVLISVAAAFFMLGVIFCVLFVLFFLWELFTAPIRINDW